MWTNRNNSWSLLDTHTEPYYVQKRQENDRFDGGMQFQLLLRNNKGKCMWQQQQQRNKKREAERGVFSMPSLLLKQTGRSFLQQFEPCYLNSRASHLISKIPGVAMAPKKDLDIPLSQVVLVKK